MRKFITNKLLVTCILFSLAVTSCKKNDRSRAKNPEFTETGDFKFLNSSLKKFVVDYAPALSNLTARTVIRNKAKQKFDEEYEVLVKDIINDPLILSLVPVEKNTVHDDLFRRSNEHLYPQIYIPRLQYLEETVPNKNSQFFRTNEDSLEEPIYVFYSGDPTADGALDSEIEDTYPGYKLTNGQLVYFTRVDESYANDHEVWILSLNETVDEQGRLPVPCEEQPCGAGCPITIESDGCGGVGGGGGGQTGGPDDDPTDAPFRQNPFPELMHNKINFMIQYMRIKTHNESWLAGASEIAIRAKLVCHNGRHLGEIGYYREEYTSDQYSNYLGKLIKKVKRKQIKNQDLITVNYSLQKNWQNEVPNQDPVHFIYVIFERDIWPAKLNEDKRSAPISLITNEPSAGEFNLYYRSGGAKNGNNWPYARYYFTNTLFLATSTNYAGTGLVEGPDMAFNTVLY